jgi:hypothetical protein
MQARAGRTPVRHFVSMEITLKSLENFSMWVSLRTAFG